jgi:hypothetical protein
VILTTPKKQIVTGVLMKKRGYVRLEKGLMIDEREIKHRANIYCK